MNVHERYYEQHHNILETRFQFRCHDKPGIYEKQCFLVFGFFIVILCMVLRLTKKRAVYRGKTVWHVPLLAGSINLIYAYVYGFSAVFNDWWFFFPDLLTKVFWTIGRGQMILGDVIFYPLATVMGQLCVIAMTRCTRVVGTRTGDDALKAVWFAVALVIVVFGSARGSAVMCGMIYWLYLPFGFAGTLLFHRFTALQLWVPTIMFMVCEFLWDCYARIFGIWIFPDPLSHPNLYFPEITLFHLGKYPCIWQPEMTQMSFVSGIISLVFFHAAGALLHKTQHLRKHPPLTPYYLYRMRQRIGRTRNAYTPAGKRTVGRKARGIRSRE